MNKKLAIAFYIISVSGTYWAAHSTGPIMPKLENSNLRRVTEEDFLKMENDIQRAKELLIRNAALMKKAGYPVTVNEK